MWVSLGPGDESVWVETVEKEMVMECPLCHVRVSEWEIRNEKTEVVGVLPTHKACLIDYKLRMGIDYREVMRKVLEARQSDWSKGVYET